MRYMSERGAAFEWPNAGGGGDREEIHDGAARRQLARRDVQLRCYDRRASPMLGCQLTRAAGRRHDDSAIHSDRGWRASRVSTWRADESTIQS
jgi:hypothetical protein